MAQRAAVPPSLACCPDCGHHFCLHRRRRSDPAPRKLDNPDPNMLGCCSAGHGSGTQENPCSCTRYRHTIEEPYLDTITEKGTNAWR